MADLPRAEILIHIAVADDKSKMLLISLHIVTMCIENAVFLCMLNKYESGRLIT
jgi:hypothetical protein